MGWSVVVWPSDLPGHMTGTLVDGAGDEAGLGVAQPPHTMIVEVVPTVLAQIDFSIAHKLPLRRHRRSRPSL